MEVKLRTIILAIPALSKLTKADLDLRLAYKLRKEVDALQKEADFFSEQRTKILDKYGTADESGSYTFEGDNEQRAADELETLLDMDVAPEVSVLEIPLSEKISISVNDIINLAPFVEFEEE